MIYEPPDNTIGIPETNQEAVDDIVSQGPGGALAVAGTAVLIVLAIWFAIYFFVFVPRT
jgi:hypothetical protein